MPRPARGLGQLRPLTGNRALRGRRSRRAGDERHQYAERIGSWKGTNDAFKGRTIHAFSTEGAGGTIVVHRWATWIVDPDARAGARPPMFGALGRAIAVRRGVRQPGRHRRLPGQRPGVAEEVLPVRNTRRHLQVDQAAQRRTPRIELDLRGPRAPRAASTCAPRPAHGRSEDFPGTSRAGREAMTRGNQCSTCADADRRRSLSVACRKRAGTARTYLILGERVVLERGRLVYSTVNLAIWIALSNLSSDPTDADRHPRRYGGGLGDGLDRCLADRASTCSTWTRAEGSGIGRHCCRRSRRHAGARSIGLED